MIWFGNDGFDSAESPFFIPLQASKFVGFSGTGTYEASSGVTSFTMDLKVDGQWVNVLKWSLNTGSRREEHSLTELNFLLALKPFDLGANKTISAIRFTSDPPGPPRVVDTTSPECQRIPCVTEADPNFKHMGITKGDHTDVTTELFLFSSIDAPTPTPLPAALPMMATVLGGAGLVAWRRRRNRAA